MMQNRRCCHEKWMPVPGHPNYRVSDQGRFRRCCPDNFLLTIYRGSVNLDGRRYSAGPIVLEAFGHPRPSPRYLALRRDFNLNNVALSNLWWGTPADRERARYTFSNPPGALLPEQVREIRRRRAAGERRKDLAKEFGVAKSTIGYVTRRETWAWVV